MKPNLKDPGPRGRVRRPGATDSTVAQRRKKTKNGEEGKNAAKRRTRPRKTRATRKGASKPDSKVSPSELGGQDKQRGLRGPEEPNAASAPSHAQESDQVLRISPPGVLYQRAGRWWWRVQLPGEDKAKARPLKAEGAKAATEDRAAAEGLAFEMWERAVAENAARQTKLESTEKIERLKAQFLDKVRHFTEIVETANAKIEEEAQARAEAEAKLAQQQLQDGPGEQQEPGEPGGPERTAAEPTPAAPVAAPAPAPGAGSEPARAAGGQIEPRTDAGAIHMVPLPGPPTTSNVINLYFEPQPGKRGHPSSAPDEPAWQERAEKGEGPASPVRYEGTPAAPPTGVCDCCGATGIAMTCLHRIDSGQSLCPRCHAAFRADIARMEKTR